MSFRLPGSVAAVNVRTLPSRGQDGFIVVVCDTFFFFGGRVRGGVVVASAGSVGWR
jgi:hypothetical protein